MNTFDVYNLEDMAWAKLQYTKKQVNEAGKTIKEFFNSSLSKYDPTTVDKSMEVLDNFRVAHAFPLNTIQNNLRRHTTATDEQSVIAQRLKRASSIFIKLTRFPTMELWDMQDIGGCRAIVHTVDDVNQIVNNIKSSSIRHKLAHEDDYIKTPRDSGYRSHHLVYRYISDKNNEYNGLKIEIQIRTLIQHYWATAVETVDTFTKQALKASRGHRDWERFFQLMGTEMAYIENTTPVPETPINRKENLLDLKRCSEKLKVKQTLNAFTSAINVATDSKLKIAKSLIGSEYFLLSLDTNAESLSITSYQTKELVQASKDYAEKEKEIREKNGHDAVLVSVDSFHTLQRAYPNYFADTSKFIELLDDSINQL